MAQILLNNVRTKLTSQLLSGGTTANVTAGEGALFVAAAGGDTIRAALVRISGHREIAWEIVDISARATDALTIVRAREGTTALQFEIGDTLSVRMTAGVMLDALGCTTTNDSADAGKLGEVIESVVPLGSAVSLVTVTPKTVTSIALTAGNWEITGLMSITGSNNVTAYVHSISLVNNTLGSENGFFNFPSAGSSQSMALITTPLKLATPTTVYLVAQSTFASGTSSAYGRITATRIR